MLFLPGLPGAARCSAVIPVEIGRCFLGVHFFFEGGGVLKESYNERMYSLLTGESHTFSSELLSGTSCLILITFGLGALTFGLGEATCTVGFLSKTCKTRGISQKEEKSTVISMPGWSSAAFFRASSSNFLAAM